jgi:hypothetical protein
VSFVEQTVSYNCGFGALSILIDHLCVDLIIGSVLCSFDPGVCFYVSIIIF